MKNRIKKPTFFRENNIKSNKMRFAFLLLSLLFISSESIAQTTLVKVVFIIEDFDTHKGISGALVTVRQTASTQPTLADGKVSFNNVPVGEIEYFIMKEGFQFETGRVNVSTDEKTNVFRIPISKIDDKKILVTGEVSDAEGRDLKDVMVEVKIADQVRTVMSDASGNYSLGIAPSIKYPASTMRIEVKKGDCKKTENVDIPKTNVVYKDFKLDCAIESSENPEKSKKALASINGNPATQTIDNVKLIVTKFEQVGSKATFYFTLENLSEAKSIRQWHVHPNFSSMNDQKGNSYKCQRIVLGNEQGKINLIYGNPVECYLEFNVGVVEVAKAAYLKIGAYNNPGTFEFTNVQVK